MKKYSIIDTIFMTFYTKRVFLDVYRNWRGLGFAYLFVVIIVFSLGELLQMQKNVTNWVVDRAPGIVAQMPLVWFENGTSHQNGSNPLSIIDPVSGEAIAVIDTGLQEITFTDSSVLIILGMKELHVNNGVTIQKVSLDRFEGLSMDSESLDYWFGVVGNWFVIFIAPFLILQSFLFHALAVIFLALLVWIYLKYFNEKFSYAVTYRVTVIATTPMLFWQAFTGLLPDSFKSLSVLTIPIGVVYIYFAAKTIKEAIISERETG